MGYSPTMATTIGNPLRTGLETVIDDYENMLSKLVTFVQVVALRTYSPGKEATLCTADASRLLTRCHRNDSMQGESSSSSRQRIVVLNVISALAVFWRTIARSGG